MLGRNIFKKNFYISTIIPWVGSCVTLLNILQSYISETFSFIPKEKANCQFAWSILALFFELKK
jgi:hypothetical protein